MRPSVVKPRYSTFVHGSCSLGVVVASAQTSDEFRFLEKVGVGTRFVIAAQPPSDSCTYGEEHGPHSAQQRHPLRISQSSAPLSNFRTVADLAGTRTGGPDTAEPQGVAQPE